MTSPIAHDADMHRSAAEDGEPNAHVIGCYGCALERRRDEGDPISYVNDAQKSYADSRPIPYDHEPPTPDLDPEARS